MAMWCEKCKDFVSELEGFRCATCAGPLLNEDKPRYQGNRDCCICEMDQAENDLDVCATCLDELTCGVYSYKEMAELFPEMCTECFIRLGEEVSGICAPCYAEVVWGGKLQDRYETSKLRTYYPSEAYSERDYSYDWWSEEPDLPIPDVADELQSIPAIRVAA